MVAKKGKKKKAGGKRYASTLPPFDFHPPTVYEMGYMTPEYVKCSIRHRSVLSSPLNFEWAAIPTDAVTLAMVKDAIAQRHSGAATGLTLFKDQAKEECSLAEVDDGTTLKQLGVQGVPPGQHVELPTVTLYYDFDSRAARHSDPIILLEANQVASKFGLNMKLFRRMEEQRKKP